MPATRCDETSIVVSHDMDFVRDICDRLALMRGGKIVQTGATDEIRSQVPEEEKDMGCHCPF